MTRLTVPVTERDHLLGNPKAPVTLVEYGDYQCPFCGAAHPVVKRLLKDMGKKVLFAFRHFPLAQVHPDAPHAAFAAEAAGLQGAFWEMHDLLFERQDALEDSDLLNYAAELGLELDRFLIDFSSEQVRLKVREDFMSGIRSGVNGTPTFFINGVRHDGSYDYKTLHAAVERAASKPAPKRRASAREAA